MNEGVFEVYEAQLALQKPAPGDSKVKAMDGVDGDADSNRAQNRDARGRASSHTYRDASEKTNSYHTI